MRIYKDNYYVDVGRNLLKEKKSLLENLNERLPRIEKLIKQLEPFNSIKKEDYFSVREKYNNFKNNKNKGDYTLHVSDFGLPSIEKLTEKAECMQIYLDTANQYNAYSPKVKKAEKKQINFSNFIFLFIALTIGFFIVMGVRKGIKAYNSYIHSEPYQTRELFSAIKRDDVQKAIDCIKTGADVNARNGSYDGLSHDTPLYIAVAKGQIRMVQLLINYGADVNIANDKGVFPIHSAVSSTGTNNKALQNQRLVILETLIKAGANLNVRNPWSNYTPLMIAISGYDAYNDVRIGEQLLQSRIKCVEMLIKAGADVNAKTNKGETPLSIAKRKQNNEMIALLRRAGAK